MKMFETQADFTTTLRKALDEIDKNWESYDGLIIPGSHTPNQVDEKLEAIKNYRENGKPALLICFGYQLGAIEYARNVLGIKDATSEEIGAGTWVVEKRKTGLKVGEKDGQTWWSNYEVTIPWEPPKNFYATPFHPEYQSSKERPAPLLLHFLQNFGSSLPKSSFLSRFYGYSG